MATRKSSTDENTVNVTWSQHTTYKDEPVAPGDTATMTKDEARAYAGAGMLTVDPEDTEAMADLAVEPSATSGNS